MVTFNHRPAWSALALVAGIYALIQVGTVLQGVSVPVAKQMEKLPVMLPADQREYWVKDAPRGLEVNIVTKDKFWLGRIYGGWRKVDSL